jgi:lysophospholipase L1-like esterase
VTVARTTRAIGLGLGGAVLATAGVAGTRRLLHAQAGAARRAIGKPLGEEAHHPARTYRRKHGRPLTLVLLGDSIAAGLGATRPRHTLGVQLAKRLGKVAGRAVRLVPCAEVGAESSWLARQVESIPDDVVPDVAVIVVGGNDVTHRVRVADSVTALEEAVVALRARGAEVVVGTCPDLGALLLVPQPLRGLARLAVAQREAVVASGGYAVSLSHVVGAQFVSDPADMFALDRFHPSGAGYRRIASAMLPSVLVALELSVDLPPGHHPPRVAPASRWLAVVSAPRPRLGGPLPSPWRSTQP